MEDINKKIGLKSELLRKAIHLSSIIIPISYYFLEKNFLLLIVGIGTALMVLLDVFRKIYPVVNNFYIKVLGIVLRKNEINAEDHFLTGGTYYALGVFLALVLFQKEIAAPAIMIMIVCDTSAALFGKTMGKHKIGNKTIEGSVAFFLVGLLIIFLTPKITNEISEYIYAVIALLIAAVIEATPIKIDDNISIPLSFGIVYTIFLYLFLL